MKKYLVIGDPIGHSLSPLIHNHWMKKYRLIESVYEKKKVEEKDLENIIKEIKEDKIEPDFVSALKLCKRRRIGALRPGANRELFYKKDMGILARGGFSFELSKRVLDLPLEEFNKLLRII